MKLNYNFNVILYIHTYMCIVQLKIPEERWNIKKDWTRKRFLVEMFKMISLGYMASLQRRTTLRQFFVQVSIVILASLLRFTVLVENLSSVHADTLPHWKIWKGHMSRHWAGQSIKVNRSDPDALSIDRDNGRRVKWGGVRKWIRFSILALKYSWDIIFSFYIVETIHWWHSFWRWRTSQSNQLRAAYMTLTVVQDIEFFFKDFERIYLTPMTLLCLFTWLSVLNVTSSDQMIWSAISGSLYQTVERSHKIGVIFI